MGALFEDKLADWSSVVTWLWLWLCLEQRDKRIFLSERMLHKDYYLKSSVEKKKSGRGSQGAWRQEELIGGKPPVVK
jgi:hypothetical protein